MMTPPKINHMYHKVVAMFVGQIVNKCLFSGHRGHLLNSTTSAQRRVADFSIRNSKVAPRSTHEKDFCF